MALTLDNHAMFDNGGLTNSFTVGSNSNRVLFVIASTANRDGPSSVTYGGNTMTSLGGTTFATFFYLINPPTGANNIVQTGGSGSRYTAAYSYFNASPTQPDNSNSSSGSGSSFSMTITPTVTGCIVLGVVTTSNSLGSLTDPGNDQTSAAMATGVTKVIIGDSAVLANTNAYTVDGTSGGGSINWNLFAITIAPPPPPLTPSVTDSSASSDTPSIETVDLLSITDTTTMSETKSLTVFFPPDPPNVIDSTAISDTPTIFIPILKFNVTDNPTASDMPVMHEFLLAPIITFRSATSPYAQLASITYSQSALGGPVLPVNQTEISSVVAFRIYNNWSLTPTIASAVNVRITTFDGIGAGSETAGQSVTSQQFIRVFESGFGENSSTPGLYTQYTGMDTAVGGSTNVYVPEIGSDGSATPQIRAGTNTYGDGFIEINSYAELPDIVGTTSYTFVIAAEYDWTS